MIEKTNNYVPSVSIGMPVYNGEKYIREALDSLLVQTFEDFELIISDNCSTDGTLIVCKEYASRDSRVRYIRQDTNIGANANFEFVLRQASGGFFMWLACDDYIEDRNYLSEMVSKINEGNDFCFPNVKLLTEDTQSRIIINGAMNRFSLCASAYDFCKQTVFICSYQIYGLFNRSFLIDNFRYINECRDLRCYGEGLFVHAITSNSTLAFVSNVNLVYRNHGENTSMTQKTGHLTIDFIKFSFKLLLFYMHHPKFSISQKSSIIKSILYTHGKYFLNLVFPILLKFKNKNYYLPPKKLNFNENLHSVMKKIKDKVKKFLQKLHIDIKKYHPQSTEKGLLNTILQQLSVDLILDIGANSGQFALGIRLAGYKHKIVSFEPLSGAHHELLQNLQMDSHWAAHDRCAVGDYDGFIDINIAGNSVSSSILPMLQTHVNAAPDSGFFGSEQVPIFKLDTISNQYTSLAQNIFLKIDTQGYEWQVLDGATLTLPHVRGILIELSITPLYDGQHLWKDIVLRLEDLGFMLWTVFPGFVDIKTAQTLQMDAVFIRTDILLKS